MKSRMFWPLLLAFCGCAAVERDCSSCWASSTGADWIILQYGYDGRPINCWKLSNAAVTNEDKTDGIYWYSLSGHLVHISGWYNRVQVQNSDYAGAAAQLGVNLSQCGEGKYKTPPAASAAASGAP